MLHSCHVNDQASESLLKYADSTVQVCGRYMLHPHNHEAREEHSSECRARHDRLAALRYSQGVECCVCMERVLEKATAAERKFGLLSCDHAFCLGCIRGWRAHHEGGADTETVSPLHTRCPTMPLCWGCFLQGSILGFCLHLQVCSVLHGFIVSHIFCFITLLGECHGMFQGSTITVTQITLQCSPFLTTASRSALSLHGCAEFDKAMQKAALCACAGPQDMPCVPHPLLVCHTKQHLACKPRREGQDRCRLQGQAWVNRLPALEFWRKHLPLWHLMLLPACLP